MLKFLVLIFCFQIFFGFTKANDFSSFLTANASLAVVVDRDYMRMRGENIIAQFEKILDDVIRENLKNGGLNVKYFTWNAVHLKKAITVTDCEQTWKFFERTRSTSILLISITDADCPRLPADQALMIPIIEHGEEFPQLMLDAKIQEVLKWKTAVLLLDESMLQQNQLLIESVAHESVKKGLAPISLVLYKIDDTLRNQKKRNFLRQLLGLFHHNEREHQKFIIFSKFFNDLIEIAAGMNMFHIYNQWLFFILNETQSEFVIEEVTQYLEDGANIAFALNETLPECVQSLNCIMSEVAKAFVTSVSRLTYEEQSIYGEISDEEWEFIRYTKQEKQAKILSYMKEYLKEYSKCASCSRWRFETALTWGKNKGKKNLQSNLVSSGSNNQNFDFIESGYWSPLLGFVMHEFVFPHIVHHFRNITMDVLTVHNPPWQIIKKDNKGAIVEHSGIVMDILKELSRLLNFTYVLHEAKDGTTKVLTGNGDSNQNRSLGSLVGSLTHILPYNVVELMQGRKYLIAAVAATINDPDKKPFNYTVPISIQKYSFITRKPDEVSRIYLFTAPFTTETWACLAGAVLITAPILYIINRLVPMEHLRIDGLCTLKNCFWYVYGALLQQGGVYLPKADSGRLVVGFWWIVVIVLVTTYCGNLVAFLTFPKFQPGLDYLFQLFKQSKIQQYGLRNGTFFQNYATSSTRDDFHKYIQRAIIYSNARDEDIGAVENGNRINIDWRINLQLIIQHHYEKDKECKFSLGKENFVDERIGLIMPSNSPYLQIVNEQITRMFQMGFIERWHQTNLPSTNKCNGKSELRQITNHKVNLDDMQGCFLVLLLGFMVALFIIVYEFWYYRLVAEPRSRKRLAFVT